MPPSCEEHLLGDPLLPLGLGALCYGCFLILLILATHILSTTSGSHCSVSKAKVSLFLAISVMFAVSTAHIISVTIFAGLWPRLQERPSATDVALGFRLQAIIVLLPIANYLISGLVAAWRAWLIWGFKVKMFLVALYVTGIIATPIAFWKQVCYGQIVGTAFSTADIVGSVFLVAFKAWQYQKFVDGELDRRTEKTKAEKILRLLLKLGVLYGAAWLTYVVAKSVPFPPLYDAMLVMLVHITGIYPTLVVFLVYRERERPDKHILPLTVMQFAPSDAISTLDVDAVLSE